MIQNKDNNGVIYVVGEMMKIKYSAFLTQIIS
jgi:hypothetical protein